MKASPVTEPALQAGDSARAAGLPRISVVIPVVGDLEALGRLLPALRGAPEPADEIVVVDGGDSEACRRLVEQHDGI